MANTSGRVTTLDTTIEFPRGESWLNKQETKNSTSNAKHKRIALEQFDEFLVDFYDTDEFDFSTIDNDLLEEFSLWLDYEKGLAHSTLQHRWYAVRKFLNDNIDEGLGHTDDEDSYTLDWLDGGTETTKQQDMDVHWLEQDKIEQLIHGAKNLKNRLVIKLLWHTGCRPSEISRMKLRRHNPDKRSIQIRTSKTDADADNHERTVFYGKSLVPDMNEWLNRGGRASHPHAEESPHLIVGYNTPSIASRQVNKIVRMAAEEAGIQESMIETAQLDDDGNPVQVNRVTPKTLRHSFAVHSVRGKELSGSPAIDIERLRRLMGHSSLEITRQYLRFRESQLRESYDRSHPA